MLIYFDLKLLLLWEDIHPVIKDFMEKYNNIESKYSEGHMINRCPLEGGDL